MQFQHHDGDDNGDDPVAEGLKPILFHAAILADRRRRGNCALKRFGNSGVAGREKVRAFEQAAEILLAGDDLGAGLAGEAGLGFVFHLEPFKPDNADELAVLFPDLGLGKFHVVDDSTFRAMLGTAG
jgi:hypothetical protein